MLVTLNIVFMLCPASCITDSPYRNEWPSWWLVVGGKCLEESYTSVGGQRVASFAIGALRSGGCASHWTPLPCATVSSDEPWDDTCDNRCVPDNDGRDGRVVVVDERNSGSSECVVDISR